MSPLVRVWLTETHDLLFAERKREHITYYPPDEIPEGGEIVEPTPKQFRDLAETYPEEFAADAQAAGIELGRKARRWLVMNPDAGDGEKEEDVAGGDDGDDSPWWHDYTKAELLTMAAEDYDLELPKSMTNEQIATAIDEAEAEAEEEPKEEE